MKVINSSTYSYCFLLLFGLSVLPQVVANNSYQQDQALHNQCKLKELCECCSVAEGNMKCQKGTLYISASYCLTWNNATDSLEISRCIYAQKHPRKVSCKDSYSIFTNITGTQLNDETCKIYNREGPRCRQCITGHGPAPFSDGFHCADCSKHRHMWILNVLAQ